MLSPAKVTYSRFLFTAQNDDSPLKFYIPPGSEKQRLKQLIEVSVCSIRQSVSWDFRNWEGHNEENLELNLKRQTPSKLDRSFINDPL